MTPPTMTPARRGTALAAAAAALVVGIAACGSSTGASGSGTTSRLAPLDAVRTGFQTLDDSHALTFTVKLDTTAAQLAALARADGDAADDSGDAVAEKVLPGGSVVLEATSGGKTFAADDGSTGGSFGLVVNAGDKPDLVQLDYLDTQLYARADVSTLASYEGSEGPAQVRSFASGAGAKFPFVAAAVAGGWLHVDGNALYQFLKTADPSAVPSATPSTTSTLLPGLEAQLGNDVTATRVAPDPTRGDHLVVTGNVKTIGADLLKAASSAEKSVPGASKIFQDAQPSGLTDKDVSVDVYVDGGAIDAVTFDLAQVLSAPDRAALGGKPLDVEIDVARTASISAPSSSTTISVSQIVQLFEGAGSLTSSLGSA